MKKPTVQDINAQVIGRKLGHLFPVTREAVEVDPETRTVGLSITSDAPILHWFGYLVLNHSPECIRMDRMAAGAPLLLEHDRECKIGGLMDAKTDGHVLRATAKFSRRPEAEAEMQDLADGIGRGVSGGFICHQIKLVAESDSDYDTYQCDDWTPIEASLVSIPADISVGVGRAFDFETREGLIPAVFVESREENPDEASDTAPVEEDEEYETECDENDSNRAANQPSEQPKPTIEVRHSVMDKDQELIHIGELFGEVEMAREFALRGKAPAELREAIFQKLCIEKPAKTEPVVELNARELKQYSIARAILADAAGRRGGEGIADENCFEREISEEIRKKLGNSATLRGGILIPTLHKRETLQRAGMDTLTSTKGQTAVYTEYGGFIDLLRNRLMVAQLGATMMPGLQGNVSMNRQTGATTFAWVAQNPGSDVADSEPTLDLVTLSPKIGQASTSYSRTLLAQSAFDVDAFVQNDLSLVNATAIDRAALHGPGTDAPTGIYGQSGVNAVAFGGPVTLDKVVDMETEIATDNSDIGTMAYLTTPGARGKAKKTQEFSSTNGMALWRDGEMNGYRAEATNQMSSLMSGSAATGGTSHGIVLGVWEHLLIGEWGALEIITDPYRLKKQGMIELTSFIMVDIQLRYATAFCKGTGQSLS